jgi:DNA-binding CsgD family transcriptional regulator
MTKNTTDPSDFDKLQEYVVSLFNDPAGREKVSKAQQEEELKSIGNTLGSERFYFVVDMTTFEITHLGGIQRWLGYFEKEFSLKKYWGLVHPGTQKSAHAVFLQMANVLCTGKFELEFMVQRYSSLTALRHSQGHYLLLKRTASVFQYDEGNRLTGYLNEFTIVGPYNGESLAPTFFTNKGEPESERGEIIMRKVMENFLNMKIFSVNELQVARMIAYQPGISQNKIAENLGVSQNTIDTYCKRFLKKSREYFQIDFSTALESAQYLRNTGLL